MLDCKQASNIISQSLDRSLTARERFALKLHLFICKYCRYFNQQMQTLLVALKKMTSTIEDDNTIEMPSTAKKRIADMVAAHSRQP